MSKSFLSLDLLRFFSAMMVVIYHFFFYSWNEKSSGGIGELLGWMVQYPDFIAYTSWGWVGVYVFFVISGFVIILSAEHKNHVDFLIGRISRLMPAILFFMTLAFVLLSITSALPIGTLALRWLKAITLFPKGPWIDGAIWTLTVELVFYFGIFVLIWLRWIRHIYILARAFAIFATAIWLTVEYHILFDLGGIGTLVTEIATSYASKFFLISTGAFFALGIIMYELHKFGHTPGRHFFIALLILNGVLALKNFALQTPGVVHFGQSPWVPSLVWAAIIALSIFSMLTERRINFTDGAKQAARSIGLTTYPLYLINQITGAFIIALLVRQGIDPVFATIIGILVILWASLIFIQKIEPPFRRRIDQTARSLLSRS